MKELSWTQEIKYAGSHLSNLENRHGCQKISLSWTHERNKTCTISHQIFPRARNWTKYNIASLWRWIEVVSSTSGWKVVHRSCDDDAYLNGICELCSPKVTVTSAQNIRFTVTLLYNRVLLHEVNANWQCFCLLSTLLKASLSLKN